MQPPLKPLNDLLIRQIRGHLFQLPEVPRRTESPLRPNPRRPQKLIFSRS